MLPFNERKTPTYNRKEKLPTESKSKNQKKCPKCKAVYYMLGECPNCRYMNMYGSDLPGIVKASDESLSKRNLPDSL